MRESGPDVSAELPIEVTDGDLCPAYTGRVLEDARVMPSPAWMRYRLHAVGVRAISNLVDVTNYILMELGQPLHAFDRDKLEGGRTEISVARDVERLVTLDGQERVLTSADLLIRDGMKPVALAGVMGGLNTEISDASRNVVVESAVFRPETIRKTARRLALSSEASYRFERGVDQVNSRFAMDRAVSLMAELSGGVVRTGACTQEPKLWAAPQPRFRVQRAVDLLGMDVEPAFCADTLERLGCGLDRSDEADWKVTTPSWRSDLSREVDLIEEIARVKGMDTIPETLPAVFRPCLGARPVPMGRAVRLQTGGPCPGARPSPMRRAKPSVMSGICRSVSVCMKICPSSTTSTFMPSCAGLRARRVGPCLKSCWRSRH